MGTAFLWYRDFHEQYVPLTFSFLQAFPDTPTSMARRLRPRRKGAHDGLVDRKWQVRPGKSRQPQMPDYSGLSQDAGK
jgi:hypothetical protein